MNSTERSQQVVFIHACVYVCVVIIIEKMLLILKGVKASRHRRSWRLDREGWKWWEYNVQVWNSQKVNFKRVGEYTEENRHARQKGRWWRKLTSEWRPTSHRMSEIASDPGSWSRPGFFPSALRVNWDLTTNWLLAFDLQNNEKTFSDVLERPICRVCYSKARK